MRDFFPKFLAQPLEVYREMLEWIEQQGREILPQLLQEMNSESFNTTRRPNECVHSGLQKENYDSRKHERHGLKSRRRWFFFSILKASSIRNSCYPIKSSMQHTAFQVSKRLARIVCVCPDLIENSWILYHDNAFAHPAFIVRERLSHGASTPFTSTSHPVTFSFS